MIPLLVAVPAPPAAMAGLNAHLHDNPQVNILIATAHQKIGSSSADGATLALAALQADKPEEALMYLAAASAKTSIDSKKTDLQADGAAVLAHIAEGVTTSDYENHKRFKEVEQENSRLRCECQQLHVKHETLKTDLADTQERLARVEVMLGQLLGMEMGVQTDRSVVSIKSL